MSLGNNSFRDFFTFKDWLFFILYKVFYFVVTILVGFAIFKFLS